MERRTFLKAGALAAAAGALPAWARREAADAWVVDRRFFERAPVAFDKPQWHVMNGDPTWLWREVLDAAWSQPGYVLAGATGADLLFTLEHLAWGRGRRVVMRQALPQHGVLHWAIAPSHPSMRG